MHQRSKDVIAQPAERRRPPAFSLSTIPVWMAFALVTATLFWTLGARAQNSPPAPAAGNPARPVEPAGDSNSEDVAIFSSDTRLVLLPVTVVDKNGKLVTNIPQSAFKVYEN